MSNNKIAGSLNYLIVSLATRYVENKRQVEGYKNNISFKDSITVFNQSNDFGFNKVSLFPFLLTIANGKKEELLKEFTDFDNQSYFKTSKEGVIHNSVNDLIKLKSVLLHFSTNQFSTTINEAIVGNYTKLEDYKSSIADAIREECPTIDIFLDMIEHSINFLHNNRIPNFANKNFSSLQYWSTDNLAFRAYNPDVTADEFTKEDVDDFVDIVNNETYNISESEILAY